VTRESTYTDEELATMSGSKLLTLFSSRRDAISGNPDSSCGAGAAAQDRANFAALRREVDIRLPPRRAALTLGGNSSVDIIGG